MKQIYFQSRNYCRKSIEDKGYPTAGLENPELTINMNHSCKNIRETQYKPVST